MHEFAAGEAVRGAAGAWLRELMAAGLDFPRAEGFIAALTEMLASSFDPDAARAERWLAPIQAELHGLAVSQGAPPLPEVLKTICSIEDRVRAWQREQSIPAGAWTVLRERFRRLLLAAARVWERVSQAREALHEEELAGLHRALVAQRFQTAQQEDALSQQLARLQWLQRVGQLVYSELKTDRSLDQALEQLPDAGGLFAEADLTSAVALIERGSERLRIVAAHGVGRDSVLGRVTETSGIPAAVLDGLLRGRRPLIVPDTRRANLQVQAALAHFFDPLQPHFFAAVPFAGPRRLLGILALVRPAPALLSEDEERLLVTFAGLTALAAENASLYMSERRRNEANDLLLSGVHDVSASLDLDEVLQTITAKARSLVQADVSAVFLTDQHGDTVLAQVVLGHLRPESSRLTVSARPGMVTEVWGSGRTLRTSDWQRDIPALGGFVAERRPVLEAEEVQALVAVPLIGQETVLGVLIAGRRRSEEFTDLQVRLLELLAAYTAGAVQNARLFDGQRVQAKEAQAVVAITRTLLRHAGLETIFQRVVQETSELLQTPVAYLSEVTADGDLVVRASQSEDGQAITGLLLAAGDGCAGLVLARGQPVRTGTGRAAGHAPAPAEHDAAGRALGLQAALGVPLRADGRLIGVLAVGRTKPEPFTAHQERRLLTLADQAALAIAWTKNLERLQRLNQELQELASRDSLTGLFNHGHFIEQVTRALSLAQRYAYPLSLLMLDIDNFKQINDIYGHPAGDAVLRQLALILDHSVRSTDTLARLPESGAVGRLGGDEFAVLMPHTDREGVELIAGRIRQMVAATPVRLSDGRAVPVSVSIGALTHQAEAGCTPAQLLQQVDLALYAAKRGAGFSAVEAGVDD